MGLCVLEDPEDPYLLEDHNNLEDPAYPDLDRQTDVIIMMLTEVPETPNFILLNKKERMSQKCL